MSNDLKVGKLKEVKLTGQLIPFRNGQPVLIDLPKLGPSLALFKTINDLQLYMQAIGVTGYTVKHVDDGTEFLTSNIPYPIVCDMRYDTTDGKSKWVLVMPLKTS